MAYGEFSEGFKKYKKLRDKKIGGLEKCGFLLLPSDLIARGFDLTDSEYFNENQEEHEFHELVKNGCRLVYLQTYINREGGLYFQSLYASPACIKELEEQLDI